MLRHLSLTVVCVVVAVSMGCRRQAPRETAELTTAPTVSQPARGPQSATLTVWDWHSADPSKGVGLWLTNIDREFEKAHPGVRVKHVGQSHTEYYEIFKAAAAAASPENGPDVVMLHQGSRIMDQRGSLKPLSGYVRPQFRKQIAGWELTSDNYDASGTPWAVPIAVQGLVWYYNKALLKDAGFEKPPATWGELLKVCDALRAKGKAGIAIGEKEGFWAEWFVNSAYFQTLTPEDVAALRDGRLKWTDAKVAAILAKLKELGDRGAFQKGALSTPLFPDAGEVFMRGEAAFFLGLISDVAHWKEFGEMLGAENLGVMTCPVYRPGPNAAKFPTGGAFAYAITKWSPRPDLAFDYIAFVANGAHANTFLSDVGSFPANQSYDRSLMSDPNAGAIAGWMASGRAGRQMTESFPTPVGEALRRECQRLLSGQTDVAGALAAVEKVARGRR